MQPTHLGDSSQQNTIQILITNTLSTACTKSFKQLYEQQQENSRSSPCRWLDSFLLGFVRLIRTIWNILIPIVVRGSSNQGQVFCSYAKRMKLDIPQNLKLSSSDIQTRLRNNQIAIMIAYTCNDYIKRDIKKLLKNKKLVQLSQKYPLCPLNNYSDYFHKYVKENIPKMYSVYIVVFGVNLLEQIMMLGVYKPIDQEVVEKVEDIVNRWKKEQREVMSGEFGDNGQSKKDIMPKVRERHFSIPKVLELGDLVFHGDDNDNVDKEEENGSNFQVKGQIGDDELAKSEVIQIQ